MVNLLVMELQNENDVEKQLKENHKSDRWLQLFIKVVVSVTTLIYAAIELVKALKN